MVLVLVLLGLVVLASDRHGVPDPLPDVALGWPLLLHVERAAALLGGIGVMVLVGWRAVHGDLPVRFGQIEYDVEKAVAGAKAMQTSHEQRLRHLEILLAARDPDEPEPPHRRP